MGSSLVALHRHVRLAIGVTLVAGCAGGRLAPPVGLARAHATLLLKVHDETRDDLALEAACRDRSRPDDDHDGLADDCEDRLAERYAPVIVHSSDESNLPTDVETFLADSSLTFRDVDCDATSNAIRVKRAPTQADLLGASFPSPCGGAAVTSDGSRSESKRRTFFLSDPSGGRRGGSLDSRRWKTYVHSYPNDLGGVTLQYWRLYAYNDAMNDHGGDWEGFHLVLDADLAVSRVRLLGHTTLLDVAPEDLEWEGEHVRLYSEGGGHATRASGETILARGCVEMDPCEVDLDEPGSFVHQETWTGGKVSWPDGERSDGGGLVNLGEKSAPLHGQVFVRYSGLWGSPGAFYMTSGYWGPAYNETAMRDDGFTTAWCAGMADGPLDRARECWAERRER